VSHPEGRGKGEAEEANQEGKLMAIFKCIDDPETGPRLKAIGITDVDLARYIVSRANGLDQNSALFNLMQGSGPDLTEAQFVLSIVEEFPIP
jgi:hypothetical protein